MAWASAALIVIAATALPFIRANDWWIRWFDFPRFQLLVLGLVVAVLRLPLGVPKNPFPAVLFLTLLMAAGYQAYRIYPYTRLSRLQVETAREEGKGVVIRLVTGNVLMENRQAGKYLQVLADVNPDIILTTEADQWWMEQLKSLDFSYPYQVKFPLENTYGMLLHSRFPLVDPSVRFLIEQDVPSIHSDIRLPDGSVMRLVGLHPRPPGPTENPDTTERDAELIVVGKSVRQSGLPFLVLGDLNDVAWSRTTTLFQEISGLLDPRIGRGMFNTFHADYFFIRFPLDHIFHSSHFQLIEMKRLPQIGSDHFPFFVTLVLRSSKVSS